jgi:Zn-dependent M28 family amino/carboxypeptidase
MVTEDRICNGATDNATGVAAVLAVAGKIAADPPDRSVVIAFWDAEEEGKLGSANFMIDQVVPTASIVAAVNIDIVGSNLLPSLRNTTFAVAAETGGPVLEDVAETTAHDTGFDVVHLSEVFARARSDHDAFIRRDIPAVFLTDSSGSCYHDADDEAGVVDHGKLERQVRWAAAIVRDLASRSSTPTFSPPSDPTYPDAVASLAMLERAVPDIGLFTTAQQTRALTNLAEVRRMVAEGPAAFDGADQLALGRAMQDASNHVQSLPCTGFLAES